MTSYFNTGDKIIDYKDKIPYVENDKNTLSVSNKQFNYVIPYSHQQQRKLFVLKMNEWLHSYNQLITYDDIIQNHSLYWDYDTNTKDTEPHLHKNVEYLEEIIKSIYMLLKKYNYKIEDKYALKEDIVYFLYSMS